MRNYKTEKFNLAKALAGAPLVTLNGQKARAVDNSRVADDGRSLIVLVKNANGEELRSYHEDGTCSTGSKQLFMYKPLTGGWINIYANRKADPTIYGTKTQANDAALPNRIAVIHAEWTEELDDDQY